jgi:hypothetical protein
MSADVRILLPDHKDSVLACAKARLAAARPQDDPMALEMSSWNARWRPEALDHYLPMGWSYGVFDDDARTLTGFLLAQPLIHHRGPVQTLWVEEVVGDDAVTGLLFDTVYRWARDKHFQCVLLEARPEWPWREWKQAHAAELPLIEWRSARF